MKTKGSTLSLAVHAKGEGEFTKCGLAIVRGRRIGTSETVSIIRDQICKRCFEITKIK